MGEAKVKPNEVLLRVGRWSIERSWERPAAGTITPPWYHDNTKSFVKHRCDGEWMVPIVYGWPDHTDNCWRCEEPIPEGIKGTWIMHNWEVIQSEAR